MPRSWTQLLKNALVSFLYASASFTGLVRGNNPVHVYDNLNDVPGEQPYAALVIANASSLRKGIIYTENNVFEGIKLSLEVDNIEYAVETTEVFDRLFCDNDYSHVPLLGEMLVFNYNENGRNAEIVMYESQMYVSANKLGKEFQEELMAGLALESVLKNNLELTRKINQGMHISQPERFIATMVQNYYLQSLAFIYSELDAGTKFPIDFQKTILGMNMVLKKGLSLDEDQALPIQFNYVFAILKEHAIRTYNKKLLNNIQAPDQQPDNSQVNIHLLIMTAMIGLVGLLAVKKYFAKNEHKNIEIIKKKIEDRQAAKKLNPAQKQEKQKPAEKKEIVDNAQPSFYIDSKKLTDAQDKLLNGKIRKILTSHAEFKHVVFVDIKNQLVDLKQYFKVDSKDYFNTLLLVQHMIQISGLKKSNPTAAQLILNQYLRNLPAMDSRPARLNPDSLGKEALSMIQSVASTKKPIINQAHPSRSRTISANPNDFKRLLELKHHLLLKMLAVHQHRENNQKQVDSLLDYRALAVLRHGLIHMDFKVELMNNDQRIVIYQDALNKLNTLGDLDQAEPRVSPIQFLVQHDLFKAFKSESVVWNEDQAKHMDSNYPACMDMIEARFLTLRENPQICDSIAAQTMLWVEIGEIYQQLRNAKFFGSLLNADPRCNPAIELRNQFVHEGKIDKAVMGRFNAAVEAYKPVVASASSSHCEARRAEAIQ